MCEFVIGVVVDVLSHVRIENRQSRGVGWVAASARNFAGIGHATQFVVLNPEIGFQNFRGRSKPEQGGIAGSEPSALFIFRGKRRAVGYVAIASVACSS